MTNGETTEESMSKTAEATPGPWSIEGVAPSPEVDLIAIRAGDETVAYTLSEANARLIAAAPALAEALKVALKDARDLQAIFDSPSIKDGRTAKSIAIFEAALKLTEEASP